VFFQKEQKLHVSDGKTQGFIGLLPLYASGSSSVFCTSNPAC